jgi:hypothetical protein
MVVSLLPPVDPQLALAAAAITRVMALSSSTPSNSSILNCTIKELQLVSINHRATRVLVTTTSSNSSSIKSREAGVEEAQQAWVGAAASTTRTSASLQWPLQCMLPAQQVAATVEHPCLPWHLLAQSARGLLVMCPRASDPDRCRQRVVPDILC